jgi:formylmethanofuran dehydrogenase subunit E
MGGDADYVHTVLHTGRECSCCGELVTEGWEDEELGDFLCSECYEEASWENAGEEPDAPN